MTTTAQIQSEVRCPACLAQHPACDHGRTCPYCASGTFVTAHEAIRAFAMAYDALEDENAVLRRTLAALGDWNALTERKEQLVDKKLGHRATEDELLELQELQRLTSARRDLLVPLPLAALERVKADLVRKGLWKD